MRQKWIIMVAYASFNNNNEKKKKIILVLAIECFQIKAEGIDNYCMIVNMNQWQILIWNMKIKSH